MLPSSEHNLSERKMLDVEDQIPIHLSQIRHSWSPRQNLSYWWDPVCSMKDRTSTWGWEWDGGYSFRLKFCSGHFKVLKILGLTIAWTYSWRADVFTSLLALCRIPDGVRILNLTSIVSELHVWEPKPRTEAEDDLVFEKAWKSWTWSYSWRETVATFTFYL